MRRTKPSPWVRWLSFERSILFGVSLILLGLAGTGVALGDWGRRLQTGSLRGYLMFLSAAVVVLFVGIVFWIRG